LCFEETQFEAAAAALDEERRGLQSTAALMISCLQG
jgi:hypothetical protein